MPSLTEQRQAVLAKARGIAEAAKTVGLSTTDKAELDRLLAKADELEADIKTARVDQDRLARIAKLGGEPGTKGYLRLGRDLAQAITRPKAGAPGGVKALVTNGGDLTSVPVTGTPIPLGRPANGLLDVLPAEVAPPQYAYVRQTVRTTNAGFVADGALKPTSVYNLVRVESRLRTVAHLSEPIPIFWLDDAQGLTAFVEEELVYGLRTRLENAVLNGSGTGEEFAGFANVSGVQVQEFTTDAIRTARAALTKIELLYEESNAYYVLHPTDWEAIETAQLTNGEYVIAEAGGATPVERASRRLWGQPVALSNAVTPGTGWLAHNAAASLRYEGQVRTDWKESSDDFERNLIRARTEGRFDLSVYRPMGIVEIELVDTP